jgi:hypothetical protein
MSESNPGNVSPNEPETADSAAKLPFNRKPRFTTLRGVRREFAALYLDLLNGRVPQKVAGTAGNVLNGIVKALEVEILESRLAELEERVGIAGSFSNRFSRGIARHAQH